MHPDNTAPEFSNDLGAPVTYDFAPVWLTQSERSNSRPGFIRRHSLFASLAIFAALPAILMAWNQIAGIYALYLVFAALLVIAVRSERLRNLAVAAAILPVSTMLTICLPHLTHLTDAAVFYGAILSFALVYRRMFASSKTGTVPEAGLVGSLADTIRMVLIGLVFGGEGYLVLRHYYLYQGTPLPLLVTVAVMSAVAEVMLFQGLIQEQASRVMRPSQAAILSTIAFTAANIGSSSWLTAAFAATIGATIAMTYYSTRNLNLAILANVAMKVSFVCLMSSVVIH
jgi:membrane protease YdiL (CAAX protease family)